MSDKDRQRNDSGKWDDGERAILASSRTSQNDEADQNRANQVTAFGRKMCFAGDTIVGRAISTVGQRVPASSATSRSE